MPPPWGGLPGPEGPRPPGRILAGLARDDTLGERDTQVQVITTAIDNQATWMLSQGRLEQQGCSFRYSAGKKGSWLVTPVGVNLRLGRDFTRMPHLHGKFTGPGDFVACQPDDPNSVALLIDTGAAIHVAGAQWRTHLKLLPGVAICSPRSVPRWIPPSCAPTTPVLCTVVHPLLCTPFSVSPL